MGLNFKHILLSRYNCFLEKDNITQKKVLKIYSTINDPVIYTAYLLRCVYAIKSGIIKQSIKQDIQNVLQQVILESKKYDDISKECYTDAIVLMDIYNKGVSVIMEYIRESEEKLPFVEFITLFNYFDAIKFLQNFDKEEYPLIHDWREFVLFLPIISYKESKILLSFEDYIYAYNKGQLDYYYRMKYNYRGSNKDSWKEIYKEELKGMSDNELNRELLKYNWGIKSVRRELLSRSKLEV